MWKRVSAPGSVSGRWRRTEKLLIALRIIRWISQAATTITMHTMASVKIVLFCSHMMASTIARRGWPLRGLG